MSPHIISSQVGIIVTKTLTLLLGGLITYYSYSAYKRTQARELRALAWGFGIMTFGAIIAGVIDIGVSTFLDRNLLPVSVFAQSLLTTIAFAVILYSLYVE